MALPDTCVEDIFRCVSYLLVMPVIMAAGLIGSFATFFVLSGPKFQSDTFFYLRALSLSDMMYLLAAFGYIYEIFFLQSFASVTTAAKESSINVAKLYNTTLYSGEFSYYLKRYFDATL